MEEELIKVINMFISKEKNHCIVWVKCSQTRRVKLKFLLSQKTKNNRVMSIIQEVVELMNTLFAPKAPRREFPSLTPPIPSVY